MLSNTVNFKNRKMKVLQQLGQGSYGTVWKVEDEKTKEIFALKVQNYVDEREQQIIQQLTQFSHRNIVNIIGFEKISDQCYGILMECCEESLFDRIQKKVYDQKDLRYILVSIVDGLKILHENKIIHRDLKPENIMIKTIKDSQNPRNTQTLYKISDFGLSTNKDINLTQQVGTCYYMAPELIKNHEYNCLVDVWSLGAISYELITNQPLFNGNTQGDILQQIVNFEKKQVQDIFNDKIKIIQEDEYQSLIKKMLEPDPSRRIDLKGVQIILRNKYSSPPRILPLLQPKIEAPKTKLVNNITFTENKHNIEQFQVLLSASKPFIQNQTQSFIQMRQNGQMQNQKKILQKEQVKVNVQPVISQIQTINKQNQKSDFNIPTDSLNNNQNFSAIHNLHKGKGWAINSPRQLERPNFFEGEELKVKSKTPENNLQKSFIFQKK